jgi:WD40 repeat protein
VLISGGADGAVIFWKVSDGSQAGKLTETSPVKALSVSRDGESVAIGCKDGQVRLRELESKKRLRVTKVQPNWVLSLAAGWGSVFAAGGDGEKVTILGAAAGKLLELKELKVSATALAFEGRGRYLAAGSSGGVIYFWLAE